MNRYPTRAFAAVLVACLVSGACSATEDEPTRQGGVIGADPAPRAVFPDDSGTGVGASRALLERSPEAVVAAVDPASQGRASSLAVALRIPMFTAVPGSGPEVTAELDRLGVGRVLLVGDADVSTGARELVVAPWGRDSLEKVAGVRFHDQVALPEDRIDDVTVHQIAEHVSLLDVGISPGENGRADAKPFTPRQAVWSGDTAPRVLVTSRTPIASIATAVAAGARVAHLAAPDPRVDGGAVEAVRTGQPIVALGPGWGDQTVFAERVRVATTSPQLAGGGQLLFPGRRFVAAYGSPISPALGILGEQGPAESVERVRRLAADYQPFSPEPVIPAFEIIGTVASTAAGPDGNFTNEWAPEELLPLVDAITHAGGYAVIDLQPGLADLLDQAKPFAELLKRPNVGLALDPEWKIRPGQQPAAQIGSADAEEINRVVTWLADLTRDSGGPQTLLILHQFNQSMITNRDRIDLSRPELAITLHADGHGTPALKTATWNALREGLDPRIRLAWKNFYDEDTPTFTPEQTMAVEPRPWFVSYQ